MAVKNYEYPRLSDWSMPQFDDPPNGKIVNVKQYPSNDHQTKQSNSLDKPVKCWAWMSPCLKGLLVGLLMNSLTLTVVLALWFTPRHETGIIVANELPVGTVLLYSSNLSTLNGSTYNWLLCDGSAVSRLTYRDLFDVIGVMYGSGNGHDTFNLPDFRQRFPLGGNGSYFGHGGASSHMITVAEMPMHSHDTGSLEILSSGEHTHTYTDPGHNHGGSTGSATFSSGSNSMVVGGGSGDDSGVHTHTISTDYTNITILPDGNHTHSLNGFTGTQGSNHSISLMPPYQTINYIIRT